MKKRISIILLSALALMGCNKEEALQPVCDTVELKASLYVPETKVGFDQEGKFYWTVNDAIGVTTSSNDVSFAKMTMDASGQGKPTATFKARFMAGTPEGYAIYPFSSNHKMNGSVLTYTFPSSYDYTIEDNDYHVTDGSGNSFNPAMWSTISNGKVRFKHLGGILCIKIVDLPAGENQTLTVTTSNRITGEFTADLTAESPALVTEASTENNAVTINYSNAVESTRVFYVPVPTGTYENITVSFVADGETFDVPFDNKTIRLRSAQRLQIGDAVIEGGEAITVENVEGANTALAEGKTSISITNVSAAQNTLVIPQQSTEDTEISVEIVTAASDAAITIEEEAGTVTSASTLYLTVPETAVNNVTINMPNTTVYVNGKIASLTATTADNTLLVNAGTEITTLYVMAGNVRLFKDGKIGSISAETPIYLVLEDGATVPATVGANVTVVSAAEFDLIQAIAAAQPGETVTLTENISTSNILVVNKAITLDGNGMTLTSAAARAINVATEGNVTIKNLTVNSSGERAINVITYPADLAVENVTAAAGNYTVNVAGSAGAAKVAISDSDLTGLNVVNIAGAGAVVTLTGTKITCNDQNANESYSALCLNKDAVGASISASGCTFDIKGDSVKAGNSAEGGTITIDNSATGENRVAAIVYGDYYNSFPTLEEAIAMATAGQTVVLTQSIEASEIITIDKAITLDGNGMTITSTAGRAININAEGNVTIKNLTVNCSGERAINVIQKPANLVIENVTATAANYTVNVATSAGAAKIAITGSTLTGKCTVNVSSPGTEVTIDGSTVNCVDDNTTTGEAYAALSLNKDAVGGKIVATNTTVNVTEGSDSVKGRNTAENGTVTINGSTEGVVTTVAVITYAGSDYYHGFATLAEAIEFAQAGQTVTLIRDITLAVNETVMIKKEISLDLNGKTVTGSNSTIATFPVLFNVNENGNLTVSNGTVNFNHVGENMGWNGGVGAFNVTAGGVLDMSGVTVNTSGTDMNFCVHLNNWGEVTLVADNCVFNATYCGVRVNNSGYDMNNVTISNSQLYGASRAFWVHNYIGDLDSSKHSDDAINTRLNLNIFGKGNTYTLSGTATSPVRYGFSNAVYINPETGEVLN